MHTYCHTTYHKWWSIYPLFQNTYPLSQVVEYILPISQHILPITSGRMYLYPLFQNTYFSAHIVPLSEHYLRSDPLNLDCVPILVFWNKYYSVSFQEKRQSGQQFLFVELAIVNDNSQVCYRAAPSTLGTLSD